MNKTSKNENGFSAVEALLIVLILLVIGAVGYMVYHNNHKTKAASVPTIAATKTATTNPYAGWNSYTSKIDGYTIKYPSNWSIKGTQDNGVNGDQVVKGSQLTGNEDPVELYYPNSTTNSLDICIFKDTKYETTASSCGGPATTSILYAGGSISKTLSNGINIWSVNQTHVDTNADFEAVTNGQFGYKLNNGTYLQISMVFGYGYGQSTTYTYSQQESSPSVTQAESILSSLSQN